MNESSFDIAAAHAKNPNYREDVERRVAKIEKSYRLADYQSQLDNAGIPINISQFADQDQRVIKCIMGGLMMFAPARKEEIA